jgi:hypothetical protein
MALSLNRHGFVDTRGPKNGHCNICDALGPLTEDHVPPKGVLKVPQADLFHIIELLSAERPVGKKKRRHMQSGVNFRSLCTRCNSALLGTKYDPAMIEFSNSVTSFLKSALVVPQIAKAEIVPGSVARSVLGHLFAVGIERRERSPLLREAADYFLDDTLPMPEGMEVYYWVYPYPRQVAVRDGALLTDFFKSPPIIFWCLKFFPLGFMITWGNKNPERVLLPRLRDYTLHSGNHPASVPLQFKPVPHQDWPEAPSDSGAVLYGDGSVGAIPRAG